MSNIEKAPSAKKQASARQITLFTLAERSHALLKPIPANARKNLAYGYIEDAASDAGEKISLKEENAIRDELFRGKHGNFSKPRKTGFAALFAPREEVQVDLVEQEEAALNQKTKPTRAW
jgi:hypothetical protein